MVREDEVFRRYWIGKNPKIKAAVMAYISPSNTKTQKQISEIHGIAEVSIIRHIHRLRELGMIEDTRGINPCIWCDTNIYAVYPKYAVSLDERKKGLKMVGYICEKCFNNIQKRRVNTE